MPVGSYMEEVEKLAVEAKPDNWQHRSSGMVCVTCMFFVEKVSKRIQHANNAFGRCRRHAPTMSGFPVVFGTDWCGDHKLDENKV